MMIYSIYQGADFMNFVFISPNFPVDYYHFCTSLSEHGVNVLGIGDAPYDSLVGELKAALSEYYRVDSLEDYEAVERACLYFEDKYGHLDWLESNNEYWLMQDARLRTRFGIVTGILEENIDFIKYKSVMKKLYEIAGVKVARYHMVDDYEGCKAFIQEVGYPVVVKPDNGVGASKTYRLDNDDDLTSFIDSKSDVPMIMEEFVYGDLVSYDGIANSKREVIYETSHVFPRQVMDIVNNNLDCFYWSIKTIPDDLRLAGQRVVRNFPSNSRCFHLEFFILKEDREGLGKKGDIIGLEVNMRTPGGVTPDMMNYAADINIFDIYADMVTKDSTNIDSSHKKYYCVYAARRKEHHYDVPLDDVRRIYQDQVVMSFTNPPAIAGAMGDDALVARFLEKEDIWPFIKAVVEDNK